MISKGIKESMTFKLYSIALFLLFTLIACKSSVSDPDPSNPSNPSNPNTASSNKITVEKIAGLAIQKGDSSCMGFARVWVDAKEGVCVGLVKAINASDKTLRKPRALIQLPDSDDFILTDMGGWGRRLGKVVKLKKHNQQYEIVDLGLNQLSLPHAVALGPTNKVFIGEDNQIFWFDASEEFPTKHVIISDLPMADGKNKHPVTLFVFDKAFNLIVNIGAPSDQCLEDKNQACRFTASTAGLRFYKRTGEMSWSPNYSVLAKGLRNSMALAIHKKSGTLIQAENAMDLKSEFSPFEEINIIEKDKHYGWPYCYNFENQSPAFSSYKGFKCQTGYQNSEGTYQAPWVLLPPHAAPLGMLYYPEDKNLFPELKGKLIIAFHGYRSPGHRIVYFDVDEKGRPKLSDNKDAFYWSDKKSINRSNIDSPYQKNFYKDYVQNMPRSAQQKELIKGWFGYSPYRPLGSPVAMTVARDGAIWFVDDTGYKSKQKGIFIIGKFDGSPRKLSDAIKDENEVSYDLKSFAKEIIQSSATIATRFMALRKNYLSKYCSGCHATTWDGGDLANRDLLLEDFYTFVFASGFVNAGNSAQSHAVMAIKSEVRPMPLNPILRPDALKNLPILENFIDQELASIRKVAVPALNVRKAPHGEKCGTVVKENMPFYILKSQKIGKLTWGQIIVPPKIKAKLIQQCQQDAFWIVVSGKYSKEF